MTMTTFDIEVEDLNAVARFYPHGDLNYTSLKHTFSFIHKVQFILLAFNSISCPIAYTLTEGKSPNLDSIINIEQLSENRYRTSYCLCKRILQLLYAKTRALLIVAFCWKVPRCFTLKRSIIKKKKHAARAGI